MGSPFARAAVWITAMDVLFEGLIALGFLATVGFQHSERIVLGLLPFEIVKAALGVLVLRSFLAPARAYGALAEEEQRRRPDQAAAAVESAFRTPFRYGLVWAALWVLHFLPVGLWFASLDEVSPKVIGIVILFSGALICGAFSFANCLMVWILTPWAGRVSLRARLSSLQLAGRGTSLAGRLLPLGMCLTLAPAFWIACPGLGAAIEHGLGESRTEASLRAARIALAPEAPLPPGGFVLDDQRRLIAGAFDPPARLSAWFGATIGRVPDGVAVDPRAEVALAYHLGGGRIAGAIVAVPGLGTHFVLLMIYAGALLIWAVICAATLMISMARPLGRLAATLEAVRLQGDVPQEVEIPAGGEIGRVCLAARETLLGVREIHGRLVEQLAGTVAELGRIAREQSRSVDEQAASLAQAAATTHQIRQTSARAALKAREVLEVAADADHLGTVGTTSLEFSLAGLVEIKEQAEAIGHRIGALEEQTTRVSEIVETVKDLADQSNILALNAGLEAAKAGDAARGFAVVAHEMRTLADRSLEATARIRQMVGEVQESIRQSVTITQGGRERMDRSIGQIRSSGETLRTLAERLRDAGRAVRQIGLTVSEQDAGIGQIVSAVQGLEGSMAQTVASIRATEQSADNVKEIASRFAEIGKAMRA